MELKKVIIDNSEHNHKVIEQIIKERVYTVPNFFTTNKKLHITLLENEHKIKPYVPINKFNSKFCYCIYVKNKLIDGLK